jgi:hypothetical protein
MDESRTLETFIQTSGFFLKAISERSHLRAKIVMVWSVPEIVRYFYKQWLFRNVSISISHDFLWFF